MKIGVAISGGVDSTAVAYQLKKEGHDVMGFTMRLCPDVSDLPTTSKSIKRARAGLVEHGCSQCIAPCACVDGRSAAKELGIKHEIIDYRDSFEDKVISPFVDAFLEGITPNPCAICNREMKFGLLVDTARQLNCEKVATGHYARLDADQDGPYLMRAVDENKDQTYFMSLVPREKFNYALFPVGNKTKTAVQADMKDKGLEPSHQETSTEICFLRERSYIEFLKDRHPAAFKEGPIVDLEGKQLGEHQGLAAYTIGQRKGLGIAASHPLYVIRLEPETNQLVVGQDQALWSRQVEVNQVNWMINQPANGLNVKALIRYRQQPVAATLNNIDKTRFTLDFEQPVRAITPGQVAAIYQEGRVLAGGLIRR